MSAEKKRMTSKNFLWSYPDGLVWRLTDKTTIRSRRQKYDQFISMLAPTPNETLLDIGANPRTQRGCNPLEQWYPHQENITALVNMPLDQFSEFRSTFPKVTLVQGDGRQLDYPDNHFDIVFSNAVVEHVGHRENQKRFIHELVRVGKRFFITTPNRWFPIDSHTMIPLAHWLDHPKQAWIYRKLGRAYFADINNLNLLGPTDFLKLFPEDANVRVIRQRMLGWSATLLAVGNKTQTT
jgi:SAM-dependent methyltransferase